MRRTLRLLRGSSRGVTLIEALVAMAIVGIIAVAFLGGLATASRSAALADIRTNAESLARTHLEYAKSQPYSPATEESSDWWDYEITVSSSLSPSDNPPDWWILSPAPPLSGHYAGYTVLVEAAPLEEDGIQIITVTVSHDSREQAVITLSGYKVDR
jgi:prepilin-type N-terminal cleavage/methylation domain-containing protein